MQQVKGKYATASRFTAFFLVTIFAAGLAYGQGQTVNSINFNIPFSFAVASKVLPAGTYTFKVERETFSSLAVYSAGTGTTRASVVTWLNGPTELFQDGSLVFERKDGGLILSEAWLPGKDGALVHPIRNGGDRVVISGMSLNPKRSYSGKDAFNLTCVRCHGDNGKGSAQADKFFGLTIPRLTSEQVQSKSDAELKQLITQGTSVMPPVEVDESGFRHRLPPQDVDAVIAYVRTLKK